MNIQVSWTAGGRRIEVSAHGDYTHERERERAPKLTAAMPRASLTTYAGPVPACRTRASRSDAQRAECSPETVAGLRDQWADSVSRAVVEDRGGVLDAQKDADVGLLLAVPDIVEKDRD